MADIKAIQTAYKGCKFRSRIEARWGVYLDALQVPWEYEKEGFEFTDGTRYLPDFWLPEQQCWLEVKGGAPTQEDLHKALRLTQHLRAPVHIASGQIGDVAWDGYEMPDVRVYLAGKISKNDWRHDVVDGLYETCREHEEGMPDRWPILTRSILGKHAYVGPYFVGCDHGCYHGINSHGVGANSNPPGCGAECALDDIRQKVWNLNTSAINLCTILVAFIDSLDCYGTLAEIGYAAGCGREVVVVSSEPRPCDQHEMWFAKQFADRSFAAHSVAERLEEILAPLDVAHQTRVAPVPCYGPAAAAACLAARSARFEHGEQPATA